MKRYFSIFLSVSILFSLFAGLGGVFATETLSVSAYKTVLVVGQSTPLTLSSTSTISNLSFDSSDQSVITVDDHTQTAYAVGKGTAIITVTGTINGIEYTDSVTIKVRTPTGIVSGKNYYIMNCGTKKYLSLESASDSNNINVIGRTRSSSYLSQWTASNVRDDGTGFTELISVYSNTDRRMYVAGTNLVIYNTSSARTIFAIHRIESGTNQGRYAMRYDDKYVAMDTSGDVYLTTSSSDNIYWTFMAVDKGYADLFSTLYTNESETFDTTTNNQKFETYLDEMGYRPQAKTNATAAYAYSRMTNDIILVICSHGNAGVMALYNDDGSENGRIVAYPSSTNSISSLPDNALSSLQCVLYIGCSTAVDYTTVTGEVYNLLDQTFEKGAHFALGTTEIVYTDQILPWFEYFLNHVLLGDSISEAIFQADRDLGTVSVPIDPDQPNGERKNVTGLPCDVVGDGNQYFDY